MKTNRQCTTSFIFAVVMPLLILSIPTSIWAQPSSGKPKLVVGIVVDQMRQEYLDRFGSRFSDGGFKRLINEGFALKNAHYNYVPTVTGAGHASIYTGTTPGIHGIIGNEWYDKQSQKVVNCVNDPEQKVIGNAGSNGDVSPWRMLTSTVTDELKLSSQKRSKVIGISIKDRGAVLPAGHMGDAAYWYDGRSGKFITSTYYMNELPVWVQDFNNQKLADKYLSQQWNTLHPVETYSASGPDETPYESKLIGKNKSTFPYDLKTLRKTNGEYELLPDVPFGNDYVTDLALAAVKNEKLGDDDAPDFLAVSFSSPDIIGHAYGPNSVEVEDTYLRLDKNIDAILKALDETPGKGNYLVFLTADHAVADVAQYLTDNKIPSGYFNSANVRARLRDYLDRFFPGREIIESMDEDQIFFNPAAFQQDPKSSGVDLMVATELTINFMLAQEGVANAYPKSLLRQGDFNEGGIKGMTIRGHHPKRSGDVVFVLQPGWYSASKIQGTTHGSPYSYDTHVPILFYGHGIPKGQSVRYHAITDIAPTISVLLGIKFPNGVTGQPVEELFMEK